MALNRNEIVLAFNILIRILYSKLTSVRGLLRWYINYLPSVFVIFYAINKSIKCFSCTEYFKSKFILCISYKYTQTIAPKLFNYKSDLQCLDIEHLLLNPPTCSCSSAPFNYQPDGHVITGDVDIVRNEELKSLILKGPKFREPPFFNWQQNFISIMDSEEGYARRWVNPKKNLIPCQNGLKQQEPL
jgi:hypothetical protein